MRTRALRLVVAAAFGLVVLASVAAVAAGMAASSPGCVTTTTREVIGRHEVLRPIGNGVSVPTMVPESVNTTTVQSCR